MKQFRAGDTGKDRRTGTKVQLNRTDKLTGLVRFKTISATSC